MSSPSAEPRSAEPHPRCTLKLINLHNQSEFDELLHQRIKCGWNNEPKVLRKWRDAMDQNKNPLFWIFSPQDTEKPVGHIGLVEEMDPPDHSLASPDKSVMHLSTLFILPAFRSGGVGRAAVEVVEAMAKIEPYGSADCKTITILTTSRRYSEDDGDDWRGIWARGGLDAPPKGRSNEDWYARMGYVKWKEEPRYEYPLLDGTETRLVAVFMRKKT